MKAIECGVSIIAATSKKEISIAKKREELAMQIDNILREQGYRPWGSMGRGGGGRKGAKYASSPS